MRRLSRRPSPKPSGASSRPTTRSEPSGPSTACEAPLYASGRQGAEVQSARSTCARVHVGGALPAFRGVGKRGNLHQRSYQPQQGLMFRPRPASQELPQFNVRQPASRRTVGLMDNERVTVRRLPPEKPGIAVWAAVQFSPFRHMRVSRCSPLGIPRDGGRPRARVKALEFQTEVAPSRAANSARIRPASSGVAGL